METACREVVRVVKPGGTVRVMFYNLRSYHYALVKFVVRPLIWLLLRVPAGERLARVAPAKFRQTYEICRHHGFDSARILNVSTDTSEIGEANFNPQSRFVTDADLRRLFAGLEHFRFYTTALKYFPIPWLRRTVEKRWGLFLQAEATKSGRGAN